MHLSRITLISYILVLGGCQQQSYHFQTVPDPLLGSRLVNAIEDDFFVLRYSAYKECAIGGTINEISVRNSSRELLHIEDISLDMAKNGRVISTPGWPKAYKLGVITFGDRPLDNVKSISSGEWIHFSFPLINCEEVDRETVLDINFQISLRAGERTYENQVRFSKEVTSSPMAWP